MPPDIYSLYNYGKPNPMRGVLERAWHKYYVSKGLHPKSLKINSLISKRVQKGKMPQVETLEGMK